MAYKLLNQPVSTIITPDAASRYLAEMNTWEGQRDINQRRVILYADLLRTGRLRPPNVDFADSPTGDRKLVNGQHVLSACVSSGTPMRAVVSYWKCETGDDMWRLYSSFDVHASRTMSDIVKGSKGLMDPMLAKVPLRVLGTCASALKDLDTCFADLRVIDKASRVGILDVHTKDVLWVSGLVRDHSILKSGAVSAMIATHRKRPQEADKFWRAVESGVGYTSRGCPEQRVRDIIQKAGRSNNSRWVKRALYCECVSWWNSWVDGTARKSVKIGSMLKLPEVK